MSFYRPVRAAASPQVSRIRIDFRAGDGRIWPFFVPVDLAMCIGRYPRLDGIEAGEPLIVFHPEGE